MLYKRDGHWGIEFIPENIKKIINEEVTICLNSVFATLYTPLTAAAAHVLFFQERAQWGTLPLCNDLCVLSCRNSKETLGNSIWLKMFIRMTYLPAHDLVC